MEGRAKFETAMQHRTARKYKHAEYKPHYIVNACPKKRELQTFLYTSSRSVAGNDGDLNGVVFSPRLLGLRVWREGGS